MLAEAIFLIATPPSYSMHFLKQKRYHAHDKVLNKIKSNKIFTNDNSTVLGERGDKITYYNIYK